MFLDTFDTLIKDKKMIDRIPDVDISRKAEILTRFKQILDNHLDDFIAGRVEKMYELKQIAAIMQNILLKR
jgi:hypothetical protein